MEQEVTQLLTQVDDLQKNRDMSDNYSSLEAKKKGLLEDETRLSERVASLEQENSRQQGHIKSLEWEKSELQVINKTLEEGCTSLREKHGSLEAELEEKSTRLQVERDEFLKQITELEEEKKALFAVDQTSQEQQDTLQMERESLQMDRDTLRIEKDSLQVERVNLQVERDNLRTERDDLQREAARLRRLSPATDGRTGVHKSRGREGQARSGRLLVVRSPRDVKTASIMRADQGFSTRRTSVSREPQQIRPILKYFLPTLI